MWVDELQIVTQWADLTLRHGSRIHGGYSQETRDAGLFRLSCCLLAAPYSFRRGCLPGTMSDTICAVGLPRPCDFGVPGTFILFIYIFTGLGPM